MIAAAPDPRVLEAWLCRRERGEPLAWITGSLEFGGRSLHVSPGVYVPRIQSEGLARRAARLLSDEGRAVDLCTGAGAIAAHVQYEVPTASVIGVDVDVEAAACARRNGVRALVGDLDLPLRPDGATDVVTAVPPYVPTGDLRLLPSDVQRYEPRAALDGGPDGLDVARRVVAAARRLLRPGGWLLVELGGDQDEVLAREMGPLGFGELESWRDDDDELKGLAARLSPEQRARRGSPESGCRRGLAMP